MRRSIAPSLIGATLLDRYVVTLDIRTGAAYLDRYSRKPMNPSSFGFALAFEDGAHVSLLWDDSPATVVGLDLGQKILSVNGVPTNSSCASIQQTLNDLAQERIELEWPGGSAVIERQ